MRVLDKSFLHQTLSNCKKGGENQILLRTSHNRQPSFRLLTRRTRDDRVTLVPGRTLANHRFHRGRIEYITQRFFAARLRFRARIHASAVETGLFRRALGVGPTARYD